MCRDAEESPKFVYGVFPPESISLPPSFSPPFPSSFLSPPLSLPPLFFLSLVPSSFLSFNNH